jgi:hypothetical protein
MMTDMEKLIVLFTEWNVGFDKKDFEEKGYCIECTQGGSNILGYPYFTTIFSFDKDGKFENMGAWE